MKKVLGVLATVVLISGCAATYDPVPKNYTGPTAVIRDSYNEVSGSQVEFFYVSKVDGHDIANARINSLNANRGRGFSMDPEGAERNLPIQPTTITIVARTQYAAPILALTHTVYEVKGEVQFTPQVGKSYMVRGTLGPDNSAVWLEDEGTNQVVGTPIKAAGSAALSILQK